MKAEEQLLILQKTVNSLEALVAALMREIAQVKGRQEAQSQQLRGIRKIWSQNQSQQDSQI